MKKSFLSLLLVAFAALTICGTTSCKNSANPTSEISSDSDTVAASEDKAVPSDQPRTLDSAPAPKGEPITVWLPAGYLPDGGYRMFIVEGDESRFIEDHIGESDTIYILRQVSYEVTEDTEEALEDGGKEHNRSGKLVVDAYDPKTKEFVARYEGEYSSFAEYDEEGEFMQGSESYSGTCTHVDGTTEEFSFYGD
ncbi:MAG: hypothetical protein IJV33_03260 [Bacteroidaceae bacterium]|nr:hypothetical protein [Bacteroidaceae bacterium]